MSLADRKPPAPLDTKARILCLDVRGMVAFPLWWLCAGLDWLPTREDGHWFRHGGWGCHPVRVSRLALWIEGPHTPNRGSVGSMDIATLLKKAEQALDSQRIEQAAGYLRLAEVAANCGISVGTTH